MLVTRYFLLILLMAFSIFGVTLVNAYAGNSAIQEENSEVYGVQSKRTIYVGRGDTLWSIAKEHKSDPQDIRQYIFMLKKSNNLKSSSLQIGQSLVLP